MTKILSENKIVDNKKPPKKTVTKKRIEVFKM